MRKLFSEKIFLSAGILLLLGNVWLMWKQNDGYTSRSYTFSRVDMATTSQLLNAGLLVPFLHWDDSMQVSDVNNKKIFLNELLKDKNRLILRFSELTCNVCVDSELLNMKKYLNVIGSENIIILASYKTIRDLIIFKRINRIEFPVFNIAESDLPVDPAGGPFLFVANAREKGFMPFIPNKEMPDLSAAYYQFIAPFFEAHPSRK